MCIEFSSFAEHILDALLIKASRKEHYVEAVHLTDA